MADGDVITLGTAKFQEVNMIPHNVLLRYDSVVVGDIRFSRKLASNLYLECTKAGTTAATEPTITGKVEGNTITDGTAVWTVKKFGGGGVGIELADVTGVGYDKAAGRVSITWTDPDDVTYQGASLARWSGTKLVRKVGSAPASVSDGTVVVDSKVRSQYSTTAFVDTGLTDGKVYYYRFFPYTDVGTYKAGTSFNATPNKLTTTMTVTKTDDSIGDAGTVNQVATVTTNGDGAIVVTSSDNSIGIASYSNGKVYVKVVSEGTITVTVTQQAGINYFGAGPKTISVKVYFSQAVGICLVQTGGGNGTWARVDKDGNTQSGIDFANTYPWRNIESVTVDGEAMVKIPKFYIKTGTFSSGTYSGKKFWIVSGSARTGFHVHPAFMKDGAEIPYFYIGAYEGYNKGSNVCGSSAGKTPWVNIGGFENAKTYCNNRGSAAGWHLQNIYERHAISLLFLLEYGHTNAQTAIGAGNVNSTAAVSTGSTNAVYRGMHELWGNVWEHVDGIKGDGSGNILIWDNKGNHTYKTTGKKPAYDGWIKDVMNDKGTDFDFGDVFIPGAVDSAETNGTLSDYCWGLANDFVLLVGGGWGDGTKGGLFAFAVHNGVSHSNGGAGLRLAKYPA